MAPIDQYSWEFNAQRLIEGQRLNTEAIEDNAARIKRLEDAALVRTTANNTRQGLLVTAAGMFYPVLRFALKYFFHIEI